MMIWRVMNPSRPWVRTASETWTYLLELPAHAGPAKRSTATSVVRSGRDRRVLEPARRGVRIPLGRRRASAAPSFSIETSASRLGIRPADGVSDADPGKGIAVSVARGTIANVTVRTPADPVRGRLARGDKRWLSIWALNTNARYTVVATAVDRDGRTVTARSTFRTLDPARTIDTHSFQGYRKTYGVGMPEAPATRRLPVAASTTTSKRLGTGASGPPLATWTKTSVPPAHEREPARCSSRVVESLDRSSASRATREGDPTYSRVETATTTPHATRTVPIIMSQYPGPSDTPKPP